MKEQENKIKKENKIKWEERQKEWQNKEGNLRRK
jgi:hypothetical protein